MVKLPFHFQVKNTKTVKNIFCSIVAGWIRCGIMGQFKFITFYLNLVHTNAFRPIFVMDNDARTVKK